MHLSTDPDANLYWRGARRYPLTDEVELTRSCRQCTSRRFQLVHDPSGKVPTAVRCNKCGLNHNDRNIADTAVKRHGVLLVPIEVPPEVRRIDLFIGSIPPMVEADEAAVTLEAGHNLAVDLRMPCPQCDAPDTFTIPISQLIPEIRQGSQRHQMRYDPAKCPNTFEGRRCDGRIYSVHADISYNARP